MFSSAWILWQSRNRGKSYIGCLRITQKALQIENIKTMSASILKYICKLRNGMYFTMGKVSKKK